SLLITKKSRQVIVAVIDTEIDIKHKNLKSNFWINDDEVPNNGKDDDNNGYVDDIQGWNFIGNLDGYNIIYSNYECVRIIQKFKDEFKGKEKEDISVSRWADYELYIAAQKDHAAKIKAAQSNYKYVEFLRTGYPAAIKALKEIYPKEDYSISDLDSLYNLYKESDKTFAKHAYFLADWTKYDMSVNWVNNYQNQLDSIRLKTNNIEYVDRLKIDSYPEDITYKNYGTPVINNNSEALYHGTKIAGLILKTVTPSDKALKSKLRLMPIPISSNGDEHDKDIALAIRYAVDNGAHIINMSLGKDFSLHEDWVLDAINFAALNDVLIVTSSGNAAVDLNETDNRTFPNDYGNEEGEISDNFLMVGSSSQKIGKSFLSYFSNYGNRHVDLFAPGEDVFTTLPNNEYDFDSGTSLSTAITSGVAALVRSYYPDLTASQVKHILMDSGIEYTIPVATPTIDDPDKMTPFNELSKSGKVLNAYNALLMADEVSSKK
ncbi:S8 family serine peptidase, partial [Nonlabens sp.]|uniref:S8 family serine peptidase n=1 Tax=Nonlabens sp. TaxID=1888209 RepID=UPI003F69F8FD